jgi:hypothetical protein
MAKKRSVKRAQAQIAALTDMLDRRVRPAADTGSQGAGTKRQSRACDARGPGVFLGAAVTKQGGTNDLTFVILDIDGRNVTNLSYAAAANAGLTQHNPYGLVCCTRRR